MLVKSKIYYVLIFITLVISSCKIQQENKLNDYLSLTKIDTQQHQTLVIIPFGGCSSCVGTAFKFLELNHSDSSILYVISNVTDPRAMRLRFREFSNAENLIIDSSPYFIKSGLNRMYPLICYLDEKGIDIREANPRNQIQWELLAKTNKLDWP